MADKKEQFTNYRVGEIIGRGRFAIVYEAEKLDIRKKVALKVLNPEFSSRADIRDQFREQARQQAKLSHPRLIRIEDLREEHGQFFVAMEYMPLGSVNSWVTQNGMLSFRQAAVIIADIAKALDYLHGKSLTHGDVKLGNILLMEDPNQQSTLRAKLSDLRLPLSVEILQTVSENLVDLTPEYISPEQAGGSQNTPFSDQYSLGIVAYELLCGQPPFSNKSQVDLYIDHQKTRPPSMQQLNEQVTPELEQVIFRALEKTPENRFPSCGEFARALRAAAAATEQKRLENLLATAERLLAKHEFGNTRETLLEALLIQPDHGITVELMKQLDQQEGLSRNYQQAVDLLKKAEEKAVTVRKSVPNDPDDAGLLKSFAPPLPPIWKQLVQRWRPAGIFASLLLIMATICMTSFTIWIDTNSNIKPTIVAMDRTLTSTFTPTFTATFTSTFTPTVTSTVTATLTPTLTPTTTNTPTPIGGGIGLIVFSSDRDGNYEIYKMNSDGSDPIRLTNSSGIDIYPSWSPDGKKIAFSSNRGGNYEIYIMNADGSGLIRLTTTIGSEYAPSWSPDGKKIAFSSNRGGNFEIYTMNADGSGDTSRLTQNAYNDITPVWSPDGKKIAFSSNRRGIYRIYVVNVDGSELTGLTSRGSQYYPAWSPDGKKIAFRSYSNSNYEIFIMDADGRNLVRLTDDTYHDYFPTWSPDGSNIAFDSSRDGGTYNIYVMNVDGSLTTRLTNNSGNNRYPDWSP